MPLFKNTSSVNGTAANHLGYLTDFAASYRLGKQLGKGGSGTVYTATRLSDGAEFAAKIIPKVLNDPRVSERKRAAQIPAIKQEVEVLLALRGNLSVANLEAVFEDDSSVTLVMELCRGGPVVGWSGPGKHPTYSERTVASYMRSVLQTIALCHARNIIHRDIKPENFLLLSEDFGAPIKAIDFGLATFFSQGMLPLTAANAEGTPWYLSPEACRGKWWPATDVWACGVMAAYMLTGMYPFVDTVTPDMPDLARTLRVICFKELDQIGPEWQGLSEDAVDFVKSLLIKDHEKRPSATDALKHPWLQDEPNRSDRPLHRSVVQRLQRFAQNSMFKRKVLEHIAQDLVTMHFGSEREKSTHGGAVFMERSVRSGRAYFEGSRHGPLDGSRHTRGGSIGGGLWRTGSAMASREGSMRLDASVIGERSVHNGGQLPSGVYLPVATPFSRRLSVLLDSLEKDADGHVHRDNLAASLHRLGYKVDDAEANELFDAVDVERTGVLKRTELTASLLDWKSVQDTYKDRWIASVRHIFSELDKDKDGALDAEEIAAAFSGHLCEYEVDAAVHEALIEAVGVPDGTEDGTADGGVKSGDTRRIDFDSFVRLLQTGSVLDDLRLYDDRLSNHTSRRNSGNLDDFERARKGVKRGGGFLCCLGG